MGFLGTDRKAREHHASGDAHEVVTKAMFVTKMQVSAADRVTCCLTGDLSKPNLGLKPDLYRELAQSLDTVIHNGALVNHAFTYEQLFEPNVLGSLEVSTADLKSGHQQESAPVPLLKGLSDVKAQCASPSEGGRLPPAHATA